ncbi:MAG: iron ABC transporter permease [Halofilum sp. (in: g-proteobacteria)]|nr:iron ABC transporter permease [Halofilum sp. (in: g-proteobacteria)]
MSTVVQPIALDTGRPPLRRRFRLDGWTLGVGLVALAFSLPIVTVVAFVLQPSGEVWDHLVDTVLWRYVSNSLTLAAGVAAGALVIGVATAWLTSMCEFPGRRFFTWALLLPLAMPSYIIAYTYTGLLEYAGPVQGALRSATGWGYGDYWFPEIRSLGGAIAMLALVLFPYVYLLARAAFLEQSLCVLEVARTLGCGAWRAFFTVAVPLARPAIAAGVSLVLMETLAEYGAVHYFGISTFTTGIFRTWFGLGDAAAAAQLAAVLLGFVFLLFVLERVSRRRARYHHTTGRYQALSGVRLRGWRAAAAVAACGLPLLLGFAVPVAQLGVWAVRTWDRMVTPAFAGLVANSFGLAAGAACVTVLLAAYLAYGQRLRSNPAVRFCVRFASMGYAIPGPVLAVGILIPFGWFDNALDAWMRAHVGISTGLLLSGTLFILVFAYAVRFMTAAVQTVESGLGKVRPSMDEAARSFGYRGTTVLARVHLPIMRGSLLTALLLVFVDVLKELPATLIMRPLDFNTLAVRAFELASDERLADSSTAALAIVITGLIPVILLSRSITRSRPGRGPADGAA